MNKEIEAVSKDLGQFTEDARELIAATADMAGDKIGEARKRLARSLDEGRGLFERARARTAEGARAADAAMHKHPYPVVGIAVGLGLLIGYLLTRRKDH
jgi:ElaB/YqjD/DUF883 family membrane-anchored ribosome-binding protein